MSSHSFFFLHSNDFDVAFFFAVDHPHRQQVEEVHIHRHRVGCQERDSKDGMD
jgi:hypothetical protein|tara:strand:- start:109 stop:267 length:159 start_codon:yes stop_codon:yes gene_type:complete